MYINFIVLQVCNIMKYFRIVFYKTIFCYIKSDSILLGANHLLISLSLTSYQRQFSKSFFKSIKPDKAELGQGDNICPNGGKGIKYLSFLLRKPQTERNSIRKYFDIKQILFKARPVSSFTRQKCSDFLPCRCIQFSEVLISICSMCLYAQLSKALLIMLLVTSYHLNSSCELIVISSS